MRCPSCGSEKLIFDPYSGELKCGDCGYVIEGIVDTGQEWRAYNEEQKLARARAEPVKPFARLMTFIGSAGTLKAERRYEFARLSALHASIVEEAKSVEAGCEEILRLTAALHLPQQVRDEAQRLFTVAQKAGLLKGSTITAMAVACVVLACKEFGIPNPISKLSQLTSAEPRKVRRSYAALVNYLNGKIVLKPVSPLKYVPMVASKLGLSQKVQMAAAKVIREAERARVIQGKPPRSVAAAALYIGALVYGERSRKRQEFAEAAGITETTLRKRAKELLRNLDIEVRI